MTSGWSREHSSIRTLLLSRALTFSRLGSRLHAVRRNPPHLLAQQAFACRLVLPFACTRLDSRGYSTICQVQRGRKCLFVLTLSQDDRCPWTWPSMERMERTECSKTNLLQTLIDRGTPSESGLLARHLSSVAPYWLCPYTLALQRRPKEGIFHLKPRRKLHAVARPTSSVFSLLEWTRPIPAPRLHTKLVNCRPASRPRILCSVGCTFGSSRSCVGYRAAVRCTAGEQPCLKNCRPIKATATSQRQREMPHMLLTATLLLQRPRGVEVRIAPNRDSSSSARNREPATAVA